MMGDCLDGLATQTAVPARLIVIDNGSTDGTFEMLQARADQLPFPTTVFQDRGSLGHIRNLAAQTASTDIVAFTDSDCVPRSDWVEQLVRAWSESQDDRLAAIQGRTVADPATPRTPWDATQDLGEFTRLFEACNISYLREPLVGSPGFDESVGFFGEDTAAGWHLLRRGWHATFAPDAIVEHAVTPVGLRWHLRRAARYGNFCVLIKTFPEMRAQLLWHRYFLRRRNAEAWLALTGVLLSFTSRVTAVIVGGTSGALIGAGVLVGAGMTVPWVQRMRPRGVSFGAIIRGLGGRAAFDLLVITSLAVGSVRHRTLVL